MESAVFSPLLPDKEEKGEVEEVVVEAEGVVSSSDTGRRRQGRRGKKKSVYKHVPHRSLDGWC